MVKHNFHLIKIDIPSIHYLLVFKNRNKASISLALLKLNSIHIFVFYKI